MQVFISKSENIFHFFLQINDYQYLTLYCYE
nr:MAG TPA: hypothetical protein [Caudoviricetes sp.]